MSLAVLFIAALTMNAGAQEPKSQAESWGLQNEAATVVSGRVVDMVCELAKDCPPQCGAGTRQLGILTPAGKLVLVVKNSQPLFTGAVPDLLPYCQKLVDVDGLMTGDDNTRVMQVQLVREQGATAWNRTELWTRQWQSRNPTLAPMAEEWFYHDPRVIKEIEQRGYLGLGNAADREFARTR
ncbi:MAG: hypothetical protein WCH83_09925 [Alphaproteobacteria bacterium]